MTRSVTERSVERLYEWTGQVPPQHQAAAEQAGSAGLTVTQALELARHPHLSVQVLLAQNPVTPEVALIELSRSESPDVRGAVALHPQCPAQTLYLLSLDPAPNVARFACRHPSTPVAALSQAATKPDQFPIVLAAIAEHPQAPAELLLRLLERGQIDVTQAVAAHPKSPLQALALLSRSNDEETLTALARRPDTPSDIQLLLAGSKYPGVRAAILSNPVTAPAVLLECARAVQSDQRWRLALHPLLPAEAMEMIAQDADPAIRQALSHHPRLPVTVLTQLAQDHDPTIQGLASSRLLSRKSGVIGETSHEKLKEELAQDARDMEAALATLDQAALIAAAERHGRRVTEADSSDLRRLRAGHEVTVLRMKRESLLRLESELSRLRREAQTKAGKTRQEIYRETDDRQHGERQEIRDGLERERQSRLQAEQERLSRVEQEAREEAQMQANQQSQQRLLGEVPIWRAAMKEKLREQIVLLREAHTQQISELEAQHLIDAEAEAQQIRERLEAEYKQGLVKAEQAAEQERKARKVVLQEEIHVRRTALEMEYAACHEADTQEHRRVMKAELTHFTDELRRQLATDWSAEQEKLDMEFDTALHQAEADVKAEDQSLRATKSAQLEAEYGERRAQIQRGNSHRLQQHLAGVREGLARDLQVWNESEAARWLSEEQAEDVQLKHAFDDQLREAEAAERAAFDQRRQTLERDSEEEWERRKVELAREYNGWLHQEVADIRVHYQTWEQTHREEQGALLAEREEESREEFILADPHRYAARLILQHGVMTEQDLLQQLPEA